MVVVSCLSYLGARESYLVRGISDYKSQSLGGIVEVVLGRRALSPGDELGWKANGTYTYGTSPLGTSWIQNIQGHG